MNKNTLIGFAYVILLVVGTVFFAIGRFGAASFIAFLATTSLIAIAFYVSERLREIDLRNLKIVLAEIKDVKADVYAKADEVRSMMVDLADSYLYSALETGRFSGEGDSLHREMIAKRERARQLLIKAGLAKTDVDTRLEKVTHLIAWDLIRDIEHKVKEAVHQRDNPNSPGFLHSFEPIDPSLADKVVGKSPADALSGIQEYIKHNNLDLGPFVNELDLLRHFMETDNLPAGKEVNKSES